MGSKFWPSGTRYTGDFKKGKAHGKGKFEDGGVTVYIGEVKKDKYNGKGVLTEGDGM